MNFKERLWPWLLGLAAAGLTILFSAYGLFSGAELSLEDLAVGTKPLPGNIVVLAIDSESLTRLGQWPWSREVFAEAIQKLNSGPPAVLGIDVVFAEPERKSGSGDKELGTALREAKFPIVLAAQAEDVLVLEKEGAKTMVASKFLKPLPDFLTGAVSLGHVNLLLDSDGLARRIPLGITDKKETLPAFALEMLRRSQLPLREDFGALDIERIVYFAKAGTVRTIPFYRLLEEDVVSMLAGKTVLIGATSPDLHDEKLTPLSRGSEMPGVEIQANILAMLMTNERLRPMNAGLLRLWLILAALLPVVIFSFSKSSLRALLFSAATGALHTLAFLFLFDQGIVGNLIAVNLSWIFATSGLFIHRYTTRERERRKIKNLFAKYVSKEVLEEILLDPKKIALGGEEKEVTVFFSDIRGFTSFSEKLPPAELVRVLNRYFTAMTDEVLKNGGVIDKFIGDAIMAFWGAPIEDPDQADHAVQAALGMLTRLEELNRELTATGDPIINIGIGIYTGPAIVGNVGSENRFDYTVMGDTVNVASRLEGQNKEYGTTIIVGESTKAKCRKKFPFKLLGQVAVKGRKEPLTVHTLEGTAKLSGDRIAGSRTV